MPQLPTALLGLVVLLIMACSVPRALAQQIGEDGRAATENSSNESQTDATEIPSANTTAPNVLIFLADDLGWGDVGFRGGQAKTKTIDQLVAEGVSFDQFYACPSCSPARAALLTGLIPHRVGIPAPVRPRDPGLPAESYLMSDAFRAAGYQTFLVGKWHLSEVLTPRLCGFDHFYGFLGASVDYYEHTSGLGAQDWYRNGRSVQEEGYSTFLFADEADQLLADRDPDRPFFLLMSMNAPHSPFQAPEEYVERYQDLGRAGVYCAMIEAMDDAFGQVLQTLDELKLADNTIVVFLSDNGAMRLGNNGPFQGGKQSSFEGGIRVPCVWKWDGHIPEGMTTQQIGCIYDLFPTLVSATGISLNRPARFDGIDLWPTICDQQGMPKSRAPNVEPSPRELVLGGTELVYRAGKWKLLENTDGTTSLFDLEADPGETKDRRSDQAEFANQFRTQLSKIKSQFPPMPTRANPRQQRLQRSSANQ